MIKKLTDKLTLKVIEGIQINKEAVLTDILKNHFNLGNCEATFRRLTCKRFEGKLDYEEFFLDEKTFLCSFTIESASLIRIDKGMTTLKLVFSSPYLKSDAYENK